jgi:hypothetical protein
MNITSPKAHALGATLAFLIMLAGAFFIVWVPNAEAQDTRQCRNNEGQVITIMAIHLCPPGYWEI